MSDEVTKINPLIDLPKLSYFAVFPDSFSATSASEQVKSSISALVKLIVLLKSGNFVFCEILMKVEFQR